ncbi:MAG: glycosyltransferase family 4 protein [Candidatus Omnitrophota bacterium]
MDEKGSILMKIIVSVGGRFHAFYLAKELFEKGYCKKLITSYPKFALKRYGIPVDKVDSIIIKEVLERGYNKLPFFLRRKFNPEFYINGLFDKLAAKRVDETDVFIGWASLSLYSMRKAKEYGAITILQRGNSHRHYQEEILRQEYERLGLEFHGSYSGLVERDIAEYEEADYIEVPSSFVKKTFVEKGIKECKIIKGFRGVNLTEFKKKEKEDTKFRIIYAGAMSIRKGVHYLLEVFNDLNLPDSELLLIGPVKDKDEIKPFFRKYEGKYKWIGKVPQSSLSNYYSQGSVFILNSIEDGFGVVIPQAMSCALPVICTTNTGGPDIITDGKEGFIIPIRDVDALKEKILFLYKNRSVCRDMGELACKKVKDFFSWQDYGKKIIAEYQVRLKRSQSKGLRKDAEENSV